jgi:NADP-dependent 3-hydroxy acid dehydrogenase YdfG
METVKGQGAVVTGAASGIGNAAAAALILANLDRGNAMSRRRVGLALPLAMTGRKPR